MKTSKWHRLIEKLTPIWLNPNHDFGVDSQFAHVSDSFTGNNHEETPRIVPFLTGAAPQTDTYFVEKNKTIANKTVLLRDTDQDVLDFIAQHLDVNSLNTAVVASTTVYPLTDINQHVDALVNLSKTNDIRFINKFFEAVNAKLHTGDMYIGCLETLSARRKRFPVATVPLLGTIYFALDFLFNRIAPKVAGVKKIYFFLTNGKSRLLSKAEVLGRLVCCGFEIVDYRYVNGLVYFVVRKVNEPTIDLNPTYGAIVKMNRMGKNGKMIGVYKFRTMHPFSEYLHNHILQLNGYAATGKPAGDFRLTPWGRVMRKYWLDELPQLINVLKGELKLVGVRPVSKRYFEDIPEDIQKMRLTQKPGCVPPYVALNKKASLENAIESEREYLQAKLKCPYTTDTKYLFMAIYNIVVRKIRSA